MPIKSFGVLSIERWSYMPPIKILSKQQWIDSMLFGDFQTQKSVYKRQAIHKFIFKERKSTMTSKMSVNRRPNPMDLFHVFDYFVQCDC